MKEGDPDYGKVFHVGDTLPDGNKFNGTMEEYKEVLVKEGIEAAKEQGANVYTDENTGETVIEIK